MNVIVTNHAYKQYCERVGDISWDNLIRQCNEQVTAGDYITHKRGFIQIGGIWWIQQREGDSIHLVTCYGKTDMDLPQAIGWAFRTGDRINLDYLV